MKADYKQFFSDMEEFRSEAKTDLYCCGCETTVSARLTNGTEIYPHRTDLYKLPFWRCDACGNFVGCHHKTNNPTRPLGCIPTPELKEARKRIHAILDPLWKGGRMTRGGVYAHLSAELGWKYHTAKIRSMDEARKVYRIVSKLHELQEVE